MTGVRYKNLHVVGGGANAAYLNQLTAASTGKTVLAGPTEATAIGNLMVQLIAKRWVLCESSDGSQHQCVYDAFEINNIRDRKIREPCTKD